MILTSENYFSPEAQRKFFGSSQFKSFMDCEARTIAEINGEYKNEATTALLIGSYVDAHFEGTLDIFMAQHPEILKRDGALKAEYVHADHIISRIEQDEMFMKYMRGGKQEIITGNWLGADWKIKIDSYHIGKVIVDLKIMKDFKPLWTDGQGKLSFVEAWGYDIQGAIYQSIEGHNLPFYIAGATKEKPEPNIALMYIPQEDLDTATEIIKAHLPRFIDVKNGIIEPRRCEKCDYCKRTKKLSEIIDYREISA